MSNRKLLQWIDKKAKRFRDEVEKLKESLNHLGAAGELEPIPIRVDEPRRRPRRRH